MIGEEKKMNNVTLLWTCREDMRARANLVQIAENCSK